MPAVSAGSDVGDDSEADSNGTGPGKSDNMKMRLMCDAA